MWINQACPAFGDTLTVVPPESPQASTVSAYSPQPRRKIFSVALAILVIIFLGAILLWLNTGKLAGSVSVLVRNADDTRAVYTLELRSKSLSETVGVNPNSITTVSTKTFFLIDGSKIMLNDAGIVHTIGDQISSVLIASPVAPVLRTPLSVSNEGARIAWMSPADNSIQVFDKTERGAYVPVYLNTELRVNSLGFNEDGSVLVASRMLESTTEIYAIHIDSGRVTLLSTIEGLASIIPTP